MPGLRPLLIHSIPQNPELSGGDQFDLSDVALDYARYIKLTDLGSVKKEGAFNGDFDLDAVVAINSKSGTPSLIPNSKIQIPKLIHLAQNYPNPFNPRTTIEFTLPVSGRIKLVVFNIHGQRIKVLLDEILSVGSHSLIWDASNLASGIYFYEIISKNFRDIKKAILIK